jgi:hypothetical protein
MNDDPFHKHLDTCERCRTQPFNLCPVGAAELRAAALARIPIACAKCQKPIRKFATGDEIPCRDCDGLLCERCCDERKKGPQPDSRDGCSASGCKSCGANSACGHDRR